ncbi:N-acetylmannosamine kinase [Companilactobacillus paralimentarius]|uniref:ROK family protein n=1 Tax=Companilactobacillus paralimentarius TaxID=83526 RepID=UPI00384CA4AE
MKKETVLAVDVGGTKVLIGEVDKEGNVLSQNKFKSDISSQKVALNQIIDAIIDYFSKEVIGDIKAIAVDIVGRVNSDKGIWYEIDPTEKNEINVSKELEKRFNLPCFVINDLAAATEAENLLGIGNVTKNFVYLSIGTGIAGRMVVDSESRVKCICGRYGCVEPLASGLGMSNQAHELKKFNDTQLEVLPNHRVGAKELFEAYDQNDPLALAVVNQSLEATSNMVMNLVRIINPKAVRFGGGVTTGGWYVDHLQKLLDLQTMRFVKYGVKNTELDPNLIALQGCALFAFSRIV